jgi:hypothetical protein
MESAKGRRERLAGVEAGLRRDLAAAGCAPEESENLVAWWRGEARFRGRLRAQLRGRSIPPPSEPARKLRDYAIARDQALMDRDPDG